MSSLETYSHYPADTRTITHQGKKSRQATKNASVKENHIVPRYISEVIVPNFTKNHCVVSPIVAAMSQSASSDWITWITHRMPSRTQLEILGAKLSRLRIIYIKENTDARWIVWQALAQGNSHSVIAEQSIWDKTDIKDMETAAKIGNTQGILVTLHN